MNGKPPGWKGEPTRHGLAARGIKTSMISRGVISDSSVIISSEHKEKIKLLRKWIKKVIPTVSVRMGRGTAWGWVEITGSGYGGKFTDKERKDLDALGFSYGGNFSVISPDDVEYYLAKVLKSKVMEIKEYPHHTMYDIHYPIGFRGVINAHNGVVKWSIRDHLGDRYDNGVAGSVDDAEVLIDHHAEDLVENLRNKGMLPREG